MGFDMPGSSEQGCWAKIHGTHNAPIFLAGEIGLPLLENIVFLTYLSLGTGDR